VHEKVARGTAADFLRRLVTAVPFKIHKVLTDNGTHFTTSGNRACRLGVKKPIFGNDCYWRKAAIG
jgi:hypothetical protein